MLGYPLMCHTICSERVSCSSKKILNNHMVQTSKHKNSGPYQMDMVVC